MLYELVATTGYRRKYAISLLNKEEIKLIIAGNEKRLTQKKYGGDSLQANLRNRDIFIERS